MSMKNHLRLNAHQRALNNSTGEFNKPYYCVSNTAVVICFCKSVHFIGQPVNEVIVVLNE